MSILYIALIGSVLAYMVFYRALKVMSASQLASLTYLEPVVTITAAIIILHEHVTLQILTGGGVILCGVYLTQLKKRPKWLRRAASAS
jgi:drug/metabolite transporter (DMT)-like permease